MTYQPDFCHIRTSESGASPALCGDKYGFTLYFAPGLQPSNPWPYERFCRECLKLHSNNQAAACRGKVVSGSDTSGYLEPEREPDGPSMEPRIA